MSYAMLVSGRIRFPEGSLAAALGSRVEPAKRTDWIGILPGGGETIDRVDSYLNALPRWIIAATGSWIEVESHVEDRTLAIRGVLGEDDFQEHATTLAEVFRTAAEVGAEGVLYYLEEQVPFHAQEPELCYVVRVTPGSSVVEHVAAEEQTEIIRGELFAQVLARITEALGQSPFEFSVPSAALKRKLAPKKKLAPKAKAKTKPAPKAKAKTKPAPKAKAKTKPASAKKRR